MLTEIMKWVSVVALLAAVFWWHSSLNVRVLVEFVVCAAAALVFVQAMRASKRLWAAGFFGIALLFNPIVPVTLPGGAFLWLDVVCLTMFLLSVALLKTAPRPSMVSIADSGRRNRSF